MIRYRPGAHAADRPYRYTVSYIQRGEKYAVSSHDTRGDAEDVAAWLTQRTKDKGLDRTVIIEDRYDPT
jgi:hypothetical protein